MMPLPSQLYTAAQTRELDRRAIATGLSAYTLMTRAGEAVVLFNSARYSNSTSKHQSLTRRALTGRNVRVFDVPSLGVDTLDHDANARYYLGKIEEARGSASRAITAVAYWHDVMRDYILEAYRYAETFPIKDRKARAAIKAFKVMRERGALFTPEESAKMQARTRAAAGARSY